MPTYKPRTLTVVAVAAAVALTAVWVLFVRNDAATVSPLRETAGWVLTVAGCGALYWRLRRPVAVAVFVLACSAVYFPLTSQDVPLLVLAFGVALYTVAAEGRLVAAATIALVTLLTVAYGELGVTGTERHVDDAAMFLLVGWFVGLVAAGYAQRTRQAYLREVEQRALAAEREKDVRAQQSATEERLRIARELHDVLGHNISLINVQAAAVLHRQAKDPSRTAELVSAMESVRDASREALRELRATLGVLRQVDEPAPTAPAEVGPGAIEELGERARSTGLDVRVAVGVPGGASGGGGADEGARGDRLPQLPPQVGLAAYRIVQESLTNVVRHAHARTARVRVWEEGAGEAAVLRVRVEDDGQGAPPGAQGSGIGGMEERARALGGVLTAGNADADADTGAGAAAAAEAGDGTDTPTRTGFVVDATLPLRMPGEVAL
ncbi:MAG TPA: histidine kinase [Streptomyces sp.]|nr:histidine kinase [Streptomyces sp.]